MKQSNPKICDKCGCKLTLGNYIILPASEPTNVEGKIRQAGYVKCSGCGLMNARVFEVDKEAK